MSIDFKALRREYGDAELDESEASPDPVERVVRWLGEAAAAGIREPNAMTLATVGADGAPSARIVLLKGLDPRGFAFYSHYGSRKGHDLAHDARAALVFFWASLERQVRVEGTVARMGSLESDAYFESRPRDARLSALTCEQSRPIESRAALEARFALVTERLAGRDEIRRPEGWGGFRLLPTSIELWQGRENRLHDRLLYSRTGPEAPWTVVRLQP